MCMRANTLETALSRDRLYTHVHVHVACLAPPDMASALAYVHMLKSRRAVGSRVQALNHQHQDLVI